MNLLGWLALAYLLGLAAFIYVWSGLHRGQQLPPPAPGAKRYDVMGNEIKREVQS